jgi:hypothetical protein
MAIKRYHHPRMDIELSKFRNGYSIKKSVWDKEKEEYVVVERITGIVSLEVASNKIKEMVLDAENLEGFHGFEIECAY